MLLQIDDWKFDIDMARTMEYSAAEAADHCDCAYCRNFYAAVDVAYPGLREFLAEFGIHIEAPEELMPFTATNILCAYAIEGKILQFGNPIMRFGDISIYAENPDTAMVPVHQVKMPYFILWVGPMDLPWVLEEPLIEEEIVSPANQPSFLKRMWNRLFGKTGKSDILS